MRNTYRDPEAVLAGLSVRASRTGGLESNAEGIQEPKTVIFVRVSLRDQGDGVLESPRSESFEAETKPAAWFMTQSWVHLLGAKILCEIMGRHHNGAACSSGVRCP